MTLLYINVAITTNANAVTVLQLLDTFLKRLKKSLSYKFGRLRYAFKA